jgi:hypothetical protein
VIIAAQALNACGERDRLVVATYNVGHLSRYLDARDWRTITPNPDD